MADSNNNDDGGFSYPGYDSSGDERSVTSSVDNNDAAADEEMDRRPWRRTAAAAAASNADDDEEEEDASTLDDGNGPWIYAEPRDNEDGDYSLAGTAVSSLGVTSYARTAAEEQSVMSQSYSMMSHQLERHQEQEHEDSYDQPPSDRALNSADNTATRGAHDDPSVGSSHTNSLFRGITRRVSEIMSVDEGAPTAAGPASASATLQAQEAEIEDEPEAEDQQDYIDMEEEEMEDQVPSPSTSAHSLHSRSSADILKSELDDAINQWESTAKLDTADDAGQQEDNSSSSHKKPKRGSTGTAAGSLSSSSGAAATSIRNLSGMLAERSSARLKKASATATKRRAGAASSAGGTSSRSGSISHGSGPRSASPSPPASRSISPPTHHKCEDYTVPSSSSVAAASNVNAAATKDNASATRASFHDSLSTTNTADLIGENANNVLLAARAPSAATFVSAARSAAHTDLNENIKERQREIELELARERRLRLQEELEQEQDQGHDQEEDGYNHYDEYGDEIYDDEASRARRASMRGEAPSTSTYGSGFPDMPPPPSEAATDSNRSALLEEGMGKKKVSFHTIVSMSTGSGDASSKKLQDAQPTHQQPQTQGQQDVSGRFSYSEDMSDDDVLAKAKAGARRAASSRNVQIGAVAVGPDGAETSAKSNLSNYQQQYLNKQQQYMGKVESSGHIIHAASANRTGDPPSLVESSKSLDYASSVQSSAAPGAYRSETNTDSRIHRKISANGGPTTAEGGYDAPSTESRINKKITANGGSAARMVAEVGRSEDGPLDRAVNRSVNRSVRKKMAALGINDMNAEVGVEEDGDYHPQSHQGGGSDESFAVRKSRAGRMTTVSRPGAHHMGDGPGKYGPHSGGKLTAEMGIEDDEEEGNGYYGRPSLDQMGPLMDASSRWMDGGADHLRKNSAPAAVCGFRRTAVLATILVAITIGMIALYVPMGPAHILPFGQDSGGRTFGGPSDSTATATAESFPAGASPDSENEAGANQAGESDAPRQKPGGVVDMANVPGSPGSGPIPGKPIIPGSPINTANGPQLTAGGPQWSSMTRAEAIRNIVEDLSDANLLDDFSSPQNRALRWITDVDEAALDETNPPRIKQRYILAVLYFATNGDSWSNNFNWLSKDHECDWNGVGYDKINDAEAEQGVFCSDEKVAVEIFIISNNMSGNLPEELGGLYQVYSVSFWTNEITGPIPKSLGRLSLLNVLGKCECIAKLLDEVVVYFAVLIYKM